METTKLRNVTTQVVSIDAAYDKAFDFISNPLTQPQWAVNFMKDVVKGKNGFIAKTAFGEMPFEIVADRSTGTIDLILGGGEPVRTRLIKNEDACEYIFTLFQPQGMPDFVWFNEGVPGMEEEMKVLKRVLESK